MPAPPVRRAQETRNLQSFDEAIDRDVDALGLYVHQRGHFKMIQSAGRIASPFYSLRCWGTIGAIGVITL